MCFLLGVFVRFVCGVLCDVARFVPLLLCVFDVIACVCVSMLSVCVSIVCGPLCVAARRVCVWFGLCVCVSCWLWFKSVCVLCVSYCVMLHGMGLFVCFVVFGVCLCVACFFFSV